MSLSPFRAGMSHVGLAFFSNDDKRFKDLDEKN
jgi:hypothetical protein